jgi:hypothetical protein
MWQLNSRSKILLPKSRELILTHRVSWLVWTNPDHANWNSASRSDPSCVLLPPKSPSRPHHNQITTIAVALSTRSGAKMSQVNKALKTAQIEEWGKVRRVDSDEGDTMRACSLGTISEDSRDATCVRVRGFHIFLNLQR